MMAALCSIMFTSAFASNAFVMVDKEVESEIRERAGSVQPNRRQGQGEYLQYERANRETAEWTAKRVLQHQLDVTLKRAEEESKSGGAAKAVTTVTRVHSALRDTSVSLGPRARTRFRYDIPSGTMSLGLLTPVADARLEHRGSSMVLGMERNFDEVKATTAVRYGVQNDQLVYGVNKRITGPLGAELDRTQAIKGDAQGETALRLSLGASF
jgi:hypothetical protein